MGWNGLCIMNFINLPVPGSVQIDVECSRCVASGWPVREHARYPAMRQRCQLNRYQLQISNIDIDNTSDIDDGGGRRGNVEASSITLNVIIVDENVITKEI